MGTIILIIAFVIEAAFTAYCILTKSNQEKARSSIRIGAFAAFILFALAAIIQWGSRWYLLAALLFFLAVSGAWTLIRSNKDKKGYKAGKTLFNAILMLLLIFIALTPALIFPQYTLPKATGRYQVATVNYTYVDKSRVETFNKTGENREVNVEFWYPVDTGGTFPLVVFSPGAIGTKSSNSSTFLELASNGYVVCSIDHPYHSLYTRDSSGHGVMINMAFIQEVLDTNNGKYDEKTALELEQKWMKLRTTDMNFVLETIITQVNGSGSDKVYPLIDSTKIGLIGHSLGGESSAQVARERSDISAVIDLDADLSGEYLGDANGKPVINDKIYTTPLLIIWSDDLANRLAAIPDLNNVVAAKKVMATAPHAYEVHLTGTNHMSLTDLPLISPFLVSMINNSVHAGGGAEVDKTTIIKKMNGIVLDFFNAYLKGNGSFSSQGTD